MNPTKEAKEMIDLLEKHHFNATCPNENCQNSFPLRNAGLFYLANFTPQARSIYEQKLLELKGRKIELSTRRKEISESAEKRSKEVNIGNISEHLAPCLKGFSFNPYDCRSLFKPIDYLIFEGLSKTGKVSRIIFAEIKTGDSKLNTRERQTMRLVEEKKVEFLTYNPEVKK